MTGLDELLPDFDFAFSTISLTANQSKSLCQGNSQRFGLLLGVGNGVLCYVAPQTMSATNRGFLLPQTGGMLALNFRDHPMVVQLEWFAFTAVAGQVIQVCEIIYRQSRGS